MSSEAYEALLPGLNIDCELASNQQIEHELPYSGVNNAP